MAKRKRLNLRLILVLSAVAVVVMVVGAYGAYKLGLHRKIIKINPVEAARKAEAAQAKGQFKSAERQLLRAISATRTPHDKAEYYYRFARLQLAWLSAERDKMNDAERTEHSSKTFRALEAAIVQDHTHLEAQKLLTELMWASSLHGGNWMAFIKEADALLALTPDDDKTTFLRALAWAELARAVPGTNSNNAVRDFRRAIELKGDDVDYHREYARFLEQDGRVDQAVTAYEDAIGKVPDDGNLRIRYAAMLVNQKRPSEAMAQIQEAITRDPNNPSGNLALADRLLSEGKSTEALAALEKARQIDDSDYRVYGILSMVYRVQQQDDKALAALRDGLTVTEKRLAETPTTSPANEQIRNALEGNRYQLLALLGNTLLDEAIGTQDEQARASLVTQAQEALDQMTWARGVPGQHEKLAGRLAFMRGDFNEAQNQLEQAYNVLGPDRHVADGLVRIYLRKNLPGKAGQILDVMRRNPALANDPRILLTKAQLEARYGNVDEANRLLDQVLRADPKNPEALNLRQTLLALRGKGSIDEMLAAGTETPQSVVLALLERAQRLWISDDRDGAVALLEQVDAKIPNNPIVQRSLLAYYVGLEDLPKAKAVLAQIKVAHPEQTATLDLQEKFIEETDRQKRYQIALQLADLNADPLRRVMDKASHAARYGDPEGEGRYLREAYQLNPDEPVVVERFMNYAIAREDWDLAQECVETARRNNLDQAGGKVFAARVAMARKDYSKAVEDLTQALNQQPEIKFAWVMLGDCYVQLGDLDRAEKAFMTIVKADPAYLPALLSMALLTERQNRTVEHAGWIDRARRLAPTHPYVLQRYLSILESQGNVDQVVAQRERLLRIDPSDMDNRLRLAVLYEKQNQLTRAGELYVGLVADNPTRLSVAGLLLAFYARTGQTAEAEKFLANVLATSPDKVGAQLLQADYLTRINLDQAEAAIAKATEIDPDDPRVYGALAAVRVQRDDWAGAADAMSKYLELRPGSASIARDIVRYRISAGQLPQAQERLQDLLTANPSDPDLLTLKGNLAMAQGDVAAAQEAFSRAIQINGQQAEALVGQAGAFLAQGKPAEAKLALTRAKGISADPQIAMLLAELHLRMGEVDSAASVLRDVLAQSDTTDYAPAIRQLLAIYEQQERWPKVVELLAQARTKFPNDPGYLMAEARIYRRTGNRARAVAAMEQAVKLAPRSKEMLVGYLLTLVEAGDLNKALTMADNYKDKPNFSPVATAVRARALAKLNRMREADALFLEAFQVASPVEMTMVVDQLKQAVGLNMAVSKMAEWVAARPNDALFHLLLGGLYLEAKDPPKAIEILSKASALATRPADKGIAERELGLAYYQTGQFPQAEQAYLSSLQARPMDPATLNNLAYMYVADLDQAAKGLPYATRAAQLAPDNPDIVDTYGWALAKTGDYIQAERQLARALQLSRSPSGTAMIRYHLGWVCEQTKRREEAVRHYTQGLQNAPDSNDPIHKDLAAALARVQQTSAASP